jgi:hypothetical protein
MASLCSTCPPFHQHNREASSEREEQHQLVVHDEAPLKEDGPARPDRVSAERVANAAKADQRARSTLYSPATA